MTYMLIQNNNSDGLSRDFSNIGFMQGRLSPVINGRVQQFPTNNWKTEMEIASKNKFRIMEWTIDTNTLNDNPLLNFDGQKLIIEKCNLNNIFVPSITCDFFMENPPWKTDKSYILEIMFKIIEGMVAIGANLIVIPLVDNSSIENDDDEKILKKFLSELSDTIEAAGISVCFESDFEPKNLKSFIEEFPNNKFGINYDIGNSASLGFNPIDEFLCYGNRIMNVHVKDRKYNGITVPLGEGDSDFKAIFKLLNYFEYKGNYILQTARSENHDHLGVLIKYRNMTQTWINENA
jgi:L-ribulose-5-phosphate 3-epimerase